MHNNLKQKILTAAVKAAESGLDRLTVSHVASVAEVTRPTVYKYFPQGRPSLIDAVRVEARRVENGTVVALFILTGVG